MDGVVLPLTECDEVGVCVPALKVGVALGTAVCVAARVNESEYD